MVCELNGVNISLGRQMNADGCRLGKKIRGLKDEKSRKYEMKQIVQNLKTDPQITQITQIGKEGKNVRK